MQSPMPVNIGPLSKSPHLDVSIRCSSSALAFAHEAFRRQWCHPCQTWLVPSELIISALLDALVFAAQPRGSVIHSLKLNCYMRHSSTGYFTCPDRTSSLVARHSTICGYKEQGARSGPSAPG